MSVRLGSNEYICKLPGGMNASIGAGQGAIQGASGIFSRMTERLAQYDKGQLNHPEQRTAEQGQKLWELG